MALGHRLQYEADNFLSRRTIALVGALFALTCCMVLTAAAVLVLAGLKPAGSSHDLDIADAIWLAVTRALDGGTVANDSGWPYRLVGLLVTVSGIFLISALIGVLVSGLDQRLAELHRGRTRVVETGHTLILGWSPQILTILHELACANRSRRLKRSGDKRNACVVILAERDRLEMEEDIRIKAPSTRGTRIVCRSGDPLDPDVLRMVSPETAHAMIVLSPGGAYPDLPVARALLALASNRDQHARQYHIVAAIQRPTNLEIMRMIVGQDAQVFLADRLIAHLIAQACRQPGLVRVYETLLRFEGIPIQFADIPTLIGVAYGEALFRIENGILIGLQSPDGAIQLNPSANTTIQPGDRLIVLKRYGESIRLTNPAHLQIHSDSIRHEPPVPLPPNHFLILGWNSCAPMILEQLSHCAPPGSQVTVSAPFPVERMQADCAEADYGSMRVTFEQGSPQDRSNLEKLTAAGCRHIVILGLVENTEVQIADAVSLVAFLYLRDIAKKTGRDLSILVEATDARSREIPGIAHADDGMIGEGIVALVLAQLAKNKDLGQVLVDLLTPERAHICLKPVGDYVRLGESVNFTALMAAAQCKGETTIGYRLHSEVKPAGLSSGIHLNPDKTTRLSFGEQDRLIVLAKG